MSTTDNEELDNLKEKILNILHKTEGCDSCKDHYSKPHKCDMDLAAPRCAARVKGIEKAILKSFTPNSEVERLVREARIDELTPLSKHNDSCNSISAFMAQKGRIDGVYVPKDPLDCFDYLCTCGALECINRLKELQAQAHKEAA